MKKDEELMISIESKDIPYMFYNDMIIKNITA